jgi:hypothetical protein
MKLIAISLTNCCAFLCLLMLAACGGGQRNTTGDPPHRVKITLEAPLGLGKDAPFVAGGQQARFAAEITGVNGPFDISWNFGAASLDSTSTLQAQGLATISTRMERLTGEQTHTVTATAVDALGNTQTASVTYQLLGWHNDPPLIESAEYSTASITAQASDIDGDELSYNLINLTTGAELGQPVELGENGAVWDLSGVTGSPLSPNDILAGGSSFGRFQVLVTDAFGAVTRSEELGSDWAEFPLEDDKLYAFATKRRVKIGEPVRVLVATGRTSAWFKYMNSVWVLSTGNPQYVSDSFDLGDMDHYPDLQLPTPVDGVWGVMDTSEFIHWPPTIFDTTVSNGDDRNRMGFSIASNDARDVIAKGFLFSFEFTFHDKGVHRLEFAPFTADLATGTWYSGGLDSEQNSVISTWSDIDNDHQYNTIVVE